MSSQNIFFNSFHVFKNESPEVSQAFENLIKSLEDLDGLDNKTKHLIYIGIQTALGNDIAVNLHVPMAKKFNATRTEIRDTILLTLTTSGGKGVFSCLSQALETYDACE